MKRKSICIPLFIIMTALVMILLCGCWDNAEINGRAFVLGFGIDDGEKADEYSFTFQMAVPVSGSSDSAEAIEYTNITISAKSAAAAIRSLEKNMGRQINFEQLTAIIVGEKMSHNKFTDITELFFRRASVRRQSCVAVCLGRAEQLLSTSATSKSISSDAAIALQSYDSNTGAGSMVMNLYTLYTAVSNKDGFYLLQISAVSDSDEQGTDDSSKLSVSGGNGKVTLEIHGASAYDREGNFLGEIDSDELEILRIVSNRQTSGIISAAGQTDGGQLYYQIKQSRCNNNCSVNGENISFNISLNIQCLLIDGYGVERDTSEKFLEYAEDCIEKELNDEINELALQSRQFLGASLLGLQDTIRQRNPAWYDEHSESWQDIYSRSNISVDVHCEIIGGDLTR